MSELHYSELYIVPVRKMSLGQRIYLPTIAETHLRTRPFLTQFSATLIKFILRVGRILKGIISSHFLHSKWLLCFFDVPFLGFHWFPANTNAHFPVVPF